MVRILHVRQATRYGGLERLIVETGTLLHQRQRHDVSILLWYSSRGVPRANRQTLPEMHPMVREAAAHGLWAEQWRDSGKLAIDLVVRTARLIRERRIELLHTHDPKTDIFGLLAARISGIPIVATAHGYHGTSWRMRSYRALDLLALRHFSRVIAVSDAFRGEIVAAGIPSHRVLTVHNAIDAATFRGSADGTSDVLRSELGLSEGDRVVVVVARLIPEKGHKDFLRAAKLVTERVSGVRFLLVGEGDLRENLENCAEKMGLADRVRFLGHRAEVAALIRLSSVLVLPSVREFFGNVLLEAGALGRPVVATAVGGAPEIVMDGETGVLVPPHDPGAMAQAIERVLTEPDWSSLLGQQAQARVESQFSLARMSEALAGVYGDVRSGMGESACQTEDLGRS